MNNIGLMYPKHIDNQQKFICKGKIFLGKEIVVEKGSDNVNIFGCDTKTILRCPVCKNIHFFGFDRVK